VAAPHNSVTAMIAAARTTVGREPNARAESSPSASALSGRARANATTDPTATNGSTLTAVEGVALASEPTVQNRMASSDAESSSIATLTNENSVAFNAAPASASRTGVADRPPPTR
jgi:hypothetical protein